MPAYEFDPSRAMLKGPDLFRRWGKIRPEGLIDQSLPHDLDLLIVQRGDERLSFLVKEIAHPHGAQGELAGEPFLISF